jgi:hypothetical protein
MFDLTTICFRSGVDAWRLSAQEAKPKYRKYLIFIRLLGLYLLQFKQRSYLKQACRYRIVTRTHAPTVYYLSATEKVSLLHLSFTLNNIQLHSVIFMQDTVHCPRYTLYKTFPELVLFSFSGDFSLHLETIYCLYFAAVSDCLPITVDARSKAWTVFARSNAGIVGSNPTQCMNVCVRLFYICVVLCLGSGLATEWSCVQGVLSTVYRIKKVEKWPRSNKRL